MTTHFDFKDSEPILTTVSACHTAFDECYVDYRRSPDRITFNSSIERGRLQTHRPEDQLSTAAHQLTRLAITAITYELDYHDSDFGLPQKLIEAGIPFDSLD